MAQKSALRSPSWNFSHSAALSGLHHSRSSMKPKRSSPHQRGQVADASYRRDRSAPEASDALEPVDLVAFGQITQALRLQPVLKIRRKLQLKLSRVLRDSRKP